MELREVSQGGLAAQQAELRTAIAAQLQKLEDDTELTSASDFRMAQRWEATNNRLGLTTVIVSGIVTVIGAVSSLEKFTDVQPLFIIVSTLLASIATAIGSVLTFLKPSERGGRYREFGNKQKMLRNRIRIYRTVQILQDDSSTGPTEQLVAFNLEKDALNSDNPPIPRSAFVTASKEIGEKRTRRDNLINAQKS